MKQLSTAAVADAAVTLGVAVRVAPASLRPVLPGVTFSGPAHPITHLGSVDVLLETIDDAEQGGVLVVDNGGRSDEACVGDLITLEAKLAGLSGIVIWGLHRDTAQLREIGLPVHSLGAYPYGPRRVPPAGRAMRAASLDGAAVVEGDLVVADDDGVLILDAARRDEVLATARGIQETEQAQAERMRAGRSLRAQLDFSAYRTQQAADPALTLRRYLQQRGSAIET
ncbi:RraA family protein [Microbacteriaceae bacterium VKM Ac-2854]|nr:RraA family protein [Microbacteriaceae bacterium VKM Ac-2854]